MDQLIEDKRHARKRILWGLILVCAGCIFLLDRMDVLDMAEFWRFWPIVILLSGLVDVLAATTWKHIAEGLNQAVGGIWLFACFEHVWGFTFGNSWPVLLIGFGVTVMVGALSKRD